MPDRTSKSHVRSATRSCRGKLKTKTKYFHWRLSGSSFRDLHLLFDEQAAAVLASIVLLAERIRRIGGGTIRGISHVSQLQIVADDNDDFVPASVMVERLLTGNRHIAVQQREAIAICGENHRDRPVQRGMPRPDVPLGDRSCRTGGAVEDDGRPVDSTFPFSAIR